MKDNRQPRFELVLSLRDHTGKDTGKTRNITSDSADELDTFWLQNNTQKKNGQNIRGIKNTRNNRKTQDRTGEPQTG